MHQHHNREVTINKANLIAKIEENRDAHIAEYDLAVEAYRKEAEKQIKRLGKELKEGKLTLVLQLVSPVNRADEYNKVIEMFNWEVSETVTLTQKEFNEYIHDDNQSAQNAKFFNSTYRNG